MGMGVCRQGYGSMWIGGMGVCRWEYVGRGMGVCKQNMGVCTLPTYHILAYPCPHTPIPMPAYSPIPAHILLYSCLHTPLPCLHAPLPLPAYYHTPAHILPCPAPPWAYSHPSTQNYRARGGLSPEIFKHVTNKYY